MDRHTQPLTLTAPIVTGNTKAAVKAAGGKSADLWMVPYDQIHYDPSDNVRPLDLEWATHLAGLMVANGYDKSQPLHCYIRKVGDRDLIHVYKGQHRYHGAGIAIRHGADLGLIPVVIKDAKSVDRVNMVFEGLTSNDSKRTSLLELAEKIAELRDIHGVDAKTISQRLDITDQTIRDVALLENAPVELHQLVRDGTVSGTLAIEQIRQYGADKALERLQKGASTAAASGKVRVTKKHLNTGAKTSSEAAPAPKTKISEPQAKQLLQALQAVLHDPVFGKLSPGTIDGVHRALTGLEDLRDAKPARRTKHPIAKLYKDGVYEPSEALSAPKSKRTGRNTAFILLAQVAVGQWIYGLSYEIGNTGGSSPCSLLDGDPAYLTRGQAIRAAVSDLTRRINNSSMSKAKEAASVRAWLDKLYLMPDPDWAEDMVKEAEK